MAITDFNLDLIIYTIKQLLPLLVPFMLLICFTYSRYLTYRESLVIFWIAIIVGITVSMFIVDDLIFPTLGIFLPSLITYFIVFSLHRLIKKIS